MSPTKQPWQTRYSTFSTNTASKFTPFTLQLKNGATSTGIAYIPTTKPLSKHKPLLIGIHGATCSAFSWDVNEKYTASIYSDLLGIPFVAFNRPNFLGSSGWLVDDDSDGEGPRYSMTEGSSYFPEEARWYDEYIFPALWEEFGVKNGCTAMVTDSHSMAVPITVIAAGLYSAKPVAERTYPWAGMVVSGFGEERLEVGEIAIANWANLTRDPAENPMGHVDGLHIGPFLKEDKIALMLGPPGTCEDELGDLCWKQNTPFFLGEVVDMAGAWVQKKEEYKAAVRIPVLYGLGTMEWLWKYTPAHVDMFTKGFVNAPRIEGGLVAGAPHAIEWSRMASGWFTRVFAWAQEVTSSMEVQKMPIQGYT